MCELTWLSEVSMRRYECEIGELGPRQNFSPTTSICFMLVSYLDIDHGSDVHHSSYSGTDVENIWKIHQ